jgi:hypothetical protein
MLLSLANTTLDAMIYAVSLTEAGMIYLARVETIIASLDEADHEAREGRANCAAYSESEHRRVLAYV